MQYYYLLELTKRSVPVGGNLVGLTNMVPSSAESSSSLEQLLGNLNHQLESTKAGNIHECSELVKPALLALHIISVAMAALVNATIVLIWCTAMY